MKYLLALLMLIASPAWADWEYVGTEEGTKAEYFLDFETLRIEGNIRKVWQLVNLPPNNKMGWSSIRARLEYDCKNETVLSMSIGAFSEQFAVGETLYRNTTASKKHDVAPDTFGWFMFQRVCQR